MNDFKVWCVDEKKAKELQQAAFKAGFKYPVDCTEATNAAAFFFDIEEKEITHQDYDYEYFKSQSYSRKPFNLAMKYFESFENRMGEKEFIEEIFELAFGDEAISKGYSFEEVIEVIKNYSDKAYRWEGLR